MAATCRDREGRIMAQNPSKDKGQSLRFALHQVFDV
jgi:hypothetical protein